ncbi:MAG: LysM repeat protein [Verrucomicrobiales bacterium]|jgi:LysM repeat protein
MTRNKKRTPRRGGHPRAVRFSAAITEEEDFTMRRPRAGLGRVFFVVLLMHVIAIGGILAFNWFGKDDTPVSSADAAGLVENSSDGSSSASQIQSRGPIVVEHPDPEFQAKGYKRYRVGLNEQLPHVARMFNASAAKIEQINGFKSGEKLYYGQWIIVVDGRGATAEIPPAPAEDPEPVAEVTLDPIETTPPPPAAQPELEPESFDEVVADRPVHERLTSIPAQAPQQQQPVSPNPAADPRLTQIHPQPQNPQNPQAPIRARPIHPIPQQQFPPQQQPQGRPRQPQSNGPASSIWQEQSGQPQFQPAAQPPAMFRTYRVVTGDTAYGIARRFGVSVQQLLNVNALNSPQLQVGQLLRVP